MNDKDYIKRINRIIINNINQSFVSIPHQEFINNVIYKAEDIGLKIIITEENYTSITSFLDNEMTIKDNYDKSRRLKRGLFKFNNGKFINVDVNGAYQTMKKVFPNAFSYGIKSW